MRLLPDLLDGARGLTGNEADAEDLVGMTVARAWDRLDDLRDRDRIRGWLFCILRNAFMDGRRREKVRPTEVPLHPGEQGMPGRGPPEGEGGDEGFSLFERLHVPVLLWTDNPEQRFLDAVLAEDLARALDALPEPFRQVVHLVDVRGFRYAEVAEALELPVGTVRSRLSRGRSLLQAHLWEHAVDRGLRPPSPSTDQPSP